MTTGDGLSILERFVEHMYVPELFTVLSIVVGDGLLLSCSALASAEACALASMLEIAEPPPSGLETNEENTV